MNEPDNPDNTDGPVEHFTADGSLAEHLRERLAEVVRLLALADQEGKRAGSAAFRLLESHRGPFAEAMANFGEALADFLAVDGAPPTLSECPAFAEQLKPLLELSRTLPVFRRAQDWGQNHEDIDEVQRATLLINRPGSDLPTLLLGDFYHSLAMACAYRARAAALAELVRLEVHTRAATQQGPVRLLRLGCGSGLEMEPVLADPGCAARLLMIYVDHSSTALRRVRQNIEKRLAHRPRFVRANPLTFGSSPNRPRDTFDIVYTLDLFDTLTIHQASELVRSCWAFLKPGGVLLTGGFLPGVPRSEKSVTAGLVGVHVLYLDETGWRQLLRAASFDLEKTQFERQTPAGITIAAVRPLR